MRKFAALILALALSLVFLTSHAFALTEEQEQTLAQHAQKMTNLYLNDMNLMRAEAYNSSLNAYFIFEQSDYSLEDIEMRESIGLHISDDLHDGFMGYSYESEMDQLTAMTGGEPVNLIAITYSTDGAIIYLSIDGVNMSHLSNFS